MRPQKRDYVSTGKPVIPEGMSKNEYKRLKRQEARLELRPIKRQQEKARKKQRRAANERLAQTEMLDKDKEADDDPISSRTKIELSETVDESAISGRNGSSGSMVPKRNAQKREDFEDLCKDNFEVVIDCDWEQDHADRPLQSLGKQILICHGLNKKSDRPCFIHLAGVGPRLSAQLEKVNYSSWRGVRTHSEDYCYIGLTKELVYLTSDGDETLDKLDPNCAYIIGGIVDRNRLKGVTYKKASQQGIRTARLPIKEYCVLHATHVLTVNHVFEILLTFARTGSWLQSFESILPQRKGVEAKPINATKGEASDVKNHNCQESSDSASL
jgi:tRNA (guanine9-N1)-methyltransferase